jgi:hypothetical protein
MDASDGRDRLGWWHWHFLVVNRDTVGVRELDSAARKFNPT